VGKAANNCSAKVRGGCRRTKKVIFSGDGCREFAGEKTGDTLN